MQKPIFPSPSAVYEHLLYIFQQKSATHFFPQKAWKSGLINCFIYPQCNLCARCQYLSIHNCISVHTTLTICHVTTWEIMPIQYPLSFVYHCSIWTNLVDLVTNCTDTETGLQYDISLNNWGYCQYHTTYLLQAPWGLIVKLTLYTVIFLVSRSCICPLSEAMPCRFCIAKHVFVYKGSCI